jgi:BRCA1-associated protein
MLTSQLDSQRIYYEDQIDDVSNQLSKLTTQIKQLEIQTKSIHKENECIEHQISLKEKELVNMTKNKQHAENSHELWKEKLETVKGLWLKEKEVTFLDFIIIN